MYHQKFFLFSLVMFFLASCSPEASNQDDSKQEYVSATSPFKSVSSSKLQLKFTSGIRAILEDAKGNIWFGSHNEGLALFDGERLTYFTVEDGLSNNQVRSIYQDANGQVWFECGIGISSFDGEKIITHDTKNYSKTEDWKLSASDLWFKGDAMVNYTEAESYPGVYRYDGQSLSFYHFPLKSSEVEKKNYYAINSAFKPKRENYSYYSVSTPFVKGKKDRVWFGTYGAVVGYNGRSFTIIDDEALGLNDETGHMHVRGLFEDSKGNLWIGNNGIGVQFYDGKKTINFSKKQGLVTPKGLNTGGFKSPPGSMEHVFSIGEDRFGNIWFGDRDTGAWKYDGTEVQNYNTEDGLSTTHIWQIYNAKNGELWFAMGDGSVCRFNGLSFDRIF